MATTAEPNYYSIKYFKWEKVGTVLQKGGLFKTKDLKNAKSWKQRFVGLYFNYLVFFEAGKGKKGEPTDKNAEAKALFPLERVKDVSKIEITYDKDGYQFTVPTKDEFFGSATLCTDTESVAVEWLHAIKANIEQILKVEKRATNEETNKRLTAVQQVFPENLKIPFSVIPSEFEAYVTNMRKYREEFKKSSLFIHSLSLFAEFQVGRVKGYQQWFSNPSKGVLASMNSSEEMVLREWREKIEKTPKEMQAATETSFFLEDLQPVIDNGKKALQTIDMYNSFAKEFHGDTAPRFAEEKNIIAAWVQKLESYPNPQDVSLSGYSDSRMDSDGGEESWSYNQGQFNMKRIASDMLYEEVEFSCREQFNMINNMYGIVLWNNKAFVWTHPRCPFIIRYDWYPTKGVFKQYISPEPKGKQPPSLTDWQYTQGALRAVTVGKRDPPPEVPDITSWTIQGNIPPHVMLLAASFRSIRPIVRGILKLPS